MITRRQVLDWAGVVFVAVCLTAASFGHLTNQDAFDWFRDTSVRMKALGATALKLKALGAHSEEIGYVDLKREDVGLYFGLQYQMLPSILLASREPQLLILHTAQRTVLAQFEQQNRLQLLGDAGDGFYLLRRMTGSGQ